MYINACVDVSKNTSERTKNYRRWSKTLVIHVVYVIKTLHLPATAYAMLSYTHVCTHVVDNCRQLKSNSQALIVNVRS